MRKLFCRTITAIAPSMMAASLSAQLAAEQNPPWEIVIEAAADADGTRTYKKPYGSITWLPDQNPTAVLASGYYRTKASRDPMGPKKIAMVAFATRCEELGGIVLGDHDPTVKDFYERMLEPGRTRDHRLGKWNGIASICAARDVSGEPIMGLAIIVHDVSPFNRNADAGSKLLNGLVGGVTHQTGIHLIRPQQLRSRASIIAEQERIAAQEQPRVATTAQQERALQAELLAFRQNLAIGEETNCGTVIERRGPMVEIAVPAYRRTPNGESTFWSHIDKLTPPNRQICTFGV